MSEAHSWPSVAAGGKRGVPVHLSPPRVSDALVNCSLKWQREIPGRAHALTSVHPSILFPLALWVIRCRIAVTASLLLFQILIEFHHVYIICRENVFGAWVPWKVGYHASWNRGIGLADFMGVHNPSCYFLCVETDGKKLPHGPWAAGHCYSVWVQRVTCLPRTQGLSDGSKSVN